MTEVKVGSTVRIIPGRHGLSSVYNNKTGKVIEQKDALGGRKNFYTSVLLDGGRNITVYTTGLEVIEQSLEDFKANLTVVAADLKKKFSWCPEGVNEFLDEIGAPRLQDKFVVTIDMTVTVDTEVSSGTAVVKRDVMNFLSGNPDLDDVLEGTSKVESVSVTKV